MSALALVFAAAIAGQVQQGRPCPPACTTTIEVRMAPTAAHRGQPGRFFLGVFPVEGRDANLSIGGYYDGRGWQVGQIPVSFAQGALLPFQRRVQIEGGLCALAKAQGASGTFAVLAGYGRDVQATRIAEVRAMAEQLRAMPDAPPDALESVQRFEALQSEQMSDVAASQAMREDGSLREIGRITCG